MREENDELKKQVEQLRHKLLMASEERAELVRLRRLLTLTPPEGWQTLGARVLAGRMGANSALASVLIGRGYMTGAIPGTPVMTPQGVAGRVLRAGPSSATVLLLIDPGSRIAVISQESRIQGVLVGGGPDKPLEMRFVSHNDVIRAGEILVTSGLDDAFPKGIPVARVLSATPSDPSRPLRWRRCPILKNYCSFPVWKAPAFPVRCPVCWKLRARPRLIRRAAPPRSAHSLSPASRALRFPVRPVPTRRFS